MFWIAYFTYKIAQYLWICHKVKNKHSLGFLIVIWNGTGVGECV